MGAFKRDIRTTAAAKDARLLYIAPEIAPGLLVEYKRDQKSGLALLQHPDGAKNWKAIDARYCNLAQLDIPKLRCLRRRDSPSQIVLWLAVVL